MGYPGEDYLTRARRLPPPATHQRDAFARASAQRHSWYKHLPVWPAAPWFFYIASDAPETSVPGARLMDKRYAHIFTAEGHAHAFGYWGCIQPYQGLGGLSAEWREKVFRAEGSQIPRHILEAGLVWVNAFIDPRAPNCRGVWEPRDRLGDIYGLIPYLASLGHEANIVTAREIAREVITEEMVKAGRERMLAEMRAAMDRVHALIWG